MKTQLSATLGLTLCLVCPLSSQAAPLQFQEQGTRLLQQFKADPRSVLMSLPPKASHSGARPFRFLTTQDVYSGDYVSKKAAFREQMWVVRDQQKFRLGQLHEGRAAISRNDRVEDLVDPPAQQILRTLESMESANLKSASLSRDNLPWSDSYWPTYEGQGAARYADPEFARLGDLEDWKPLNDWAHDPTRSFKRIFSDLRDSKSSPYPLDRLAPSEKYDLLVGDAEGSLTENGWKAGREYYEDRSNKGKVEAWMGLCHGWAAAALMEKRPQQSVSLLAADGKTRIQFFPSDIKALTSTLWANAEAPARYVGERCDDKSPPKDENGRTQSTKCFDTNPGTWHQAIVNQIGVAKRGFVMDATYDFEVWNHPVFAYEYSYFNPQTQEQTDKLKEASVNKTDFTQDKFKRYRSPKSTAFVGVLMKVKYVTETEATQDEQDGPDNDAHDEVLYMYDLELDSSGQIIGGEWYQNAHPDFLWVNPPRTSAQSSADALTTASWSPLMDPIPESWRSLAPASARSGLPLAKIVKGLIGESQRNRRR